MCGSSAWASSWVTIGPERVTPSLVALPQAIARQQISSPMIGNCRISRFQVLGSLPLESGASGAICSFRNHGRGYEKYYLEVHDFFVLGSERYFVCFPR